MSDCLRPDEPQAAVEQHELRESTLSGNSCEQISVPVRQEIPAASASSARAQAAAEGPAENCPVGEADEVTGENGWPGEEPSFDAALPRRPMAGPRKGRRLVRREDSPRTPFNPEQRLLILDSWQRSGLPAGDFAPLVGVSKHTLYAWKKQFDLHGPAGLMEQPRGVRTGSRMPEVTKRSILLMKQSHPDWGCQRISDMLLRGPALPASASAVARVLHEAGYELEEVTTRPHPDKPRHFERARPNQLWQTDLFTFMLKRQNRRVYLVAFLDDHSRFLVGYGLHASQSTALVLEVLRAAIGSYGPPEEVLTDNARTALAYQVAMIVQTLGNKQWRPYNAVGGPVCDGEFAYHW